MSAAPAYFTKDELLSLDSEKIPYHIAFIPDGNRRWAKSRSFDISSGHKHGASNLIGIVKAAKQIGVKQVSFYLFSTENWSRPEEEIHALMLLLQQFLIDENQSMIDEGIRVNTIGDLSRLPAPVVETIAWSKEQTKHGDQVELALALNYGGRSEMARAMKKIAEEVAAGSLDPSTIDEQSIEKRLETYRFKDPELLIRTSGENRISNFLLWKLSYTELYFSDILWPDFRPCHLMEAVKDYQKRERRLGGQGCSKQ